MAHTENQILRDLSEHVGSLLGSCFSNPGAPRRLEHHDFTSRGRCVENSTSNLIVRLILAPFPIGKPLFYSEKVSAKPDFYSVHFVQRMEKSTPPSWRSPSKTPASSLLGRATFSPSSVSGKETSFPGRGSSLCGSASRRLWEGSAKFEKCLFELGFVWMMRRSPWPLFGESGPATRGSESRDPLYPDVAACWDNRYC